MVEIDVSLKYWGWFFLIFYIGMMLLFGYIGMRRVTSSDDFATARASYGPWFLALALVATTASGATFLGLPSLAYKGGMSVIWYAIFYPAGVYLGVFIALRAIRRAGAAFGNRSIPEYLGDRFNSEVLRVAVAVFSLLLLFYLAAQLLSGAVMFNTMMGIDRMTGLIVTSVILVFYIVIGGSHADILTDGVQSVLMLILAVVVCYMFFTGMGVTGGFNGMLTRLEEIDPNLTKPLNPKHPLLNSWWDIFSLWAANVSLGLLPHTGNKLWALKNDKDQMKFITISCVLGFFLPTLVFGGILARAVLGDVLLSDGANPNDAIPMLFITLFPTWLAALIGAGVLAAVMSTADGLVVSSGQIFANDIYRRTIAPRSKNPPSDEKIDRISLTISRIATIFIMVGAATIAWSAQDMNIALLLWVGVGGMTAANFGPLFLGILWRRSTKAGAIAGFIAGGITFIVTKMGLIKAEWFSGSSFETMGTWLAAQAISPFACSTIGSFMSLGVMYIVSLITQPPDSEHLKRVFGS